MSIDERYFYFLTNGRTFFFILKKENFVGKTKLLQKNFGYVKIIENAKILCVTMFILFLYFFNIYRIKIERRKIPWPQRLCKFIVVYWRSITVFLAPIILLPVILLNDIQVSFHLSFIIIIQTFTYLRVDKTQII